jgi:hypothetical protein
VNLYSIGSLYDTVSAIWPTGKDPYTVGFFSINEEEGHSFGLSVHAICLLRLYAYSSKLF